MDSQAPEFVMLAQLADIDPEKMGAAFNDPPHLFEHLTLEDLGKIQEGCARFATLQREILGALDKFSAFANGFLAGRRA